MTDQAVFLEEEMSTQQEVEVEQESEVEPTTIPESVQELSMRLRLFIDGPTC